jgi:hypothetical protein
MSFLELSFTLIPHFSSRLFLSALLLTGLKDSLLIHFSVLIVANLFLGAGTLGLGLDPSTVDLPREAIWTTGFPGDFYIRVCAVEIDD